MALRERKTLQMTSLLAEGKFDFVVFTNDQDDVSPIHKNIKRIVQRINLVIEYVQRVSNGEDPADLQIDHKDKLGSALLDMGKKMKMLEEEEQERSWAVRGLARFSEILSSNIISLEELSFQIISNLVKFVGANQGGFFIQQEEKTGEKYLELMAAYAYEKKKFIEKKVYFGEGLLGQSILEKEFIYQTEVPENYVTITSGLGAALPRNLIIMPLLVNDEVYGAIELASFHKLKTYQLEFLKKVAENIASTVASVKANAHTHRLLEESKILTEELQNREKKMQQNMKELATTQEEMQHKQAELDGLFKAIDMTIPTVEFDLEGTIKNVNDLYLSINGFHKEDLIGKTYDILLSATERNKPQTAMMWDNLRRGQSFSGEFKNVNKQGGEMHLLGTYCPILNSYGNPDKVVLFAQFTTQGKEKQKDIVSSLYAFIKSVPMLEINDDFKIKTVNDTFIRLLEHKKFAVIRKELNTLLSSESQIETNQLLSKLSQDGKFYEMHLTFMKGNGQAEKFRTTFTAIKSLEGKIYKIIVLLMHSE